MLEAVIATAVLGLALLGATRLVTHALHSAQQQRHLLQAQALASDALDCALAQTLPCPAAQTLATGGMTYTVAWQRQMAGPHLHDLSVQVRWGTSPEALTAQLTWHTRASTLPDWAGL